MKTNELLLKINTAWKAYKAYLKELPLEAWHKPIKNSRWTPKDGLAHITWFEQEMLDLVTTKKLEGSPWWMLPTDERNEKIYEQYKIKPLDQVQKDAKSTHSKLISAIGTLNDDELINAASFENMPHDWEPWNIIAQNTYLHYRDHIEK